MFAIRPSRHLIYLLISLAIQCSSLIVPGTVDAQTASPVTGIAQPELASVDQLMLTFLSEEAAPGASVAITFHGRLVYARGFGWADREAREAVQPNSLFRIASLSKAITATAVLRLADQGKIHLDDHAFVELGLQPVLQPGVQPDPRFAKITVLNLLQHRGGFDRAISGDPEFQTIAIARLCGSQPPATAQQTIRVVEGRPLDFDPGSRYAYSPFGYCVLGRVIEHATKSTYEQYVSSQILVPLGIHDMKLGRSLPKDRAPGEVRYYTPGNKTGASAFSANDQQVPSPYGTWSMEAHDSNGGWIATAADMVRFVSAFDRPEACDVLSREAYAEMFAPPQGAGQSAAGGSASEPWYGCGWHIRQFAPGRFNAWHDGSLPGTSTLMMRHWKGYDFAVLFNQKDDAEGKELSAQIFKKMTAALSAIRHWPQGVDRQQAWPEG